MSPGSQMRALTANRAKANSSTIKAGKTVDPATSAHHGVALPSCTQQQQGKSEGGQTQPTIELLMQQEATNTK